MLIQTLSLCPRSWKMLCLFEEYKIEYRAQQLPINCKLEFPIIDKYNSDFSYLFANLTKFASGENEAQIYGIWSSIIDCSIIPEIINQIRYERIIKPIVHREYSCLATLRAKRTQLKQKLKEISEYLSNNQWLSGKHFSICDITLATAIACMDYLGEIQWQDQDLQHLYNWYLKIKSRPSFQVVLEQKCSGVNPHANFAKIDF